MAGYPIELQASVIEPATLGGNLQFTGEGGGAQKGRQAGICRR